jgi:DNA invertase Pin-like site-specific DNA recombinase
MRSGLAASRLLSHYGGHEIRLRPHLRGRQSAALQHTALRQAGCKTIFTDELSGAITKRPALLRCMKKLERGDMLGFA